MSALIACPVCGSELGVQGREWALEHHDDGSHTAWSIEARIDEQYRHTEERLATDPEWIALKEAAAREAAATPDYWWARNMLVVRREIETPL